MHRQEAVRCGSCSRLTQDGTSPSSLEGDKSGRWDSWYMWAIPAADRLFDVYLQEFGD